ncbi:MAG: sulfite exporter TauE/SafE family protein, partial [Pseudomonadota bacterium]
TEPIIVYIFLALVFSAFIKGSLGLGFSTICLALLVQVIELKIAISIVLFPSLLSNFLVMWDAGHYRVSLRLFWSMLAMAVPGMLIGLQLLRQDDNTISLFMLGFVLIAYGAWGYNNHSFRLREGLMKPLNPLIGLATGAVNGATGSQIFPIMPYLMSLPISREVLIQTINASFTLCSLIMLVGLSYFGSLDLNQSVYFSAGIIPVLCGVWLGNQARKRMSEEVYRRSVMILLIVLGILLLLRQLSS